MWALWKLRGLDLNSALVDLHKAGLIGITAEALLAKMRAAEGPFSERRPLDTSEPDGLEGALSHAGLLTAFDAETDELPCSHDRLILRFAENTDGRFRPECAVETWHRKSEDEVRGPYTVRFVHEGRLYRFGAQDRGDWYDVEAVQRAMNYALETAGRKERFLALEGDGQVASFVFADPAAFAPVARTYGLPLSDDPDAAMRKGKEYERHVIESFGK